MELLEIGLRDGATRVRALEVELLVSGFERSRPQQWQGQQPGSLREGLLVEVGF